MLLECEGMLVLGAVASSSISSISSAQTTTTTKKNFGWKREE
jgi:hypothetical protein